MIFCLKHKVGALAEALNIFYRYNINLTLIQSIPLPGKPQEYAFHIDLEWKNLSHYSKALEGIKKITTKLKILGEYQHGELPYNSNKKNDKKVGQYEEN